MKRRGPTANEISAVADALEMMMRLRQTMPYRSRGFALLNSACWRLSNRLWAELGMPERQRESA